MEQIVCQRCGCIDEYYTVESGPHIKAMCNHCNKYIKFISKHKTNNMGLENNTHSVFLSIGDGKITKRVKQPTEKSSSRVLKNGNTIHEEIYDAVSGTITDIKVHEHKEWGRFWNVSLRDDDGTEFVLQMNYSGGYASAFLKALPNADVNQKIKFIPSMKMEGDKKKVSLFLSQNGQALKHYFTKDNPNGLPQMTQVKVKGKMTWDDSDMMQFLEDMVNSQILPKLKNVKMAMSEVDGTSGADEEASDDDGLPF